MRTRLVQTNEVRRSASLALALMEVQRRTPGRMALIDVGASSGFNLLIDKYFYKYSDGSSAGEEGSDLVIDCDIRGTKPKMNALPLIETRLGIDLNPIDLNIPAERLWAFSLVWPDQQERLERLKAAMQILKDNPVKIHRGGANDILPMMIQNLQAGLTVCVMHSFTLNQFSTDDREKFENVLRSSSLKRDIWRVSLEWLDTESPELSLDHFADGTRIGHEVLANCHQHGEWIEWRPKTKASV